MWDGVSSALTTTALGSSITDVVGIPIVPAILLAVIAVSLVVFAGRRLMRLQPRG